MRVKTFVWGFILLLAIAFITYEIVHERYEKPVQVIKTDEQSSRS